MTRPARPGGQPAAQIPASLARHLAGAVDLSSLRRPATPPPAGGAAPGGAAPAGSTPDAEGTTAGGSSPYVRAVTTATFEADVINASMQVPVLIDFWADWCQPCKQLSPVLEALVNEYGGRVLLATIDVDAEPQLGQAFQVQSIPSVFAVIAGQPVPLFQGAIPAAQAREFVDEVLRVAAANGVSGVLDAAASDQAPPTQTVDPLWADATEAIDRGDVHGALAAYQQLVERDPRDEVAKAGLARCELLVRTQGVDQREVLERAAAAPDDVAAQSLAADVEVLLDQVNAAVERMVGLVRRTTGADRDAARTHLLGLFEVLDPDDPRLAAGRRALANALF